jgi:hypothetical protein
MLDVSDPQRYSKTIIDQTNSEQNYDYLNDVLDSLDARRARVNRIVNDHGSEFSFAPNNSEHSLALTKKTKSDLPTIGMTKAQLI